MKPQKQIKHLTPEQAENWHKIHTLFCQHCKALQKVNGLIIDCWWNPLNHGNEHAFCGANEDAVKELFNLCRSQIEQETRQKCSETLSHFIESHFEDMGGKSIDDLGEIMSEWGIK